MAVFSSFAVTRDIEEYGRDCKNYVEQCLKIAQAQMYVKIYNSTPVTRKRYNSLVPGSGSRMKNGWYEDKVALGSRKKTNGATISSNGRVYVVRNVIKPQAVHFATTSHHHKSYGVYNGETKENDFIYAAQHDGQITFEEMLEQRFEKV